MNFLKILQKTSPTAKETAAEIKTLGSLKKTAQENIEKLSLSLENHRLEVLGGQATRDTLDSMKAEHSEAVETGKTIGIALEKLRRIYIDAVKNELGKKLEKLKQERVQLIEDRSIIVQRLLKSAGTTAGLSYLLRGGMPIEIGEHKLPVSADAADGVSVSYFREAFDQVVGGELPWTRKQAYLDIDIAALEKQFIKE